MPRPNSELSDLIHGRPDRSNRGSPEMAESDLRSELWTLEWSRPNCRKRNFIAGPSGFRPVCLNRQSTAPSKQFIVSSRRRPSEEESQRLLKEIKDYLNALVSV